MHVGNWMRQEVQTINPDEDLLKAWRMMMVYRVRHLPVVDGSGALVGIVSDRDIKKHALPEESGRTILARQQHMEQLPVSQVMIRKVITVPRDLPMEAAAQIMIDHHFDSLPVTEEGNLVGILTSTDFLKYVVRNGTG